MMHRRIELCRQALSLVKREENVSIWGGLHLELAGCLAQSPLGSRADNLEQAIEHCQQALQVLTREADPTNWAAIQNDLANIYIERIRGDRAENLDRGIAHYEQVLQVLTREASPDRWGMTQMNLATAYHDRIYGDRAGNLEQAITHHEQALQVLTREIFPYGWAMTQHNLANTFLERIHGDRAKNLEQAIAHAQQALQVRTWEAFPADWAMTQHNLSVAYCDRIWGDRAENLELAIAHAQQALQVFTHVAFPVDWALTQRNLANVYRRRIRGDRATNLERAIMHCQQALQVWTQEADPTNWAGIQHHLANAYSERLLGDRATNLEQAIAHAQEALQVRTREANPTNWAAIQNDLANVYGDRILGDRQENIEQAIAHYRRVLEVYTREADPGRWAGIQHNLGVTYFNRICGDRATNLEQAIAHYEQALQVYTCATDPITFQLTQRNLGDLHFSEGAWEAALVAYQEAIRGGQMMFGGAYTEAGRLSEAAQTATVYARAAYALLKRGRTGEALVQLEQGKTRLLSQALALNELDLNLLPRPQQKTLRDLRDTIRALEADMRLPPDTIAHRDERVLAARLNQARTELHDIIEGIRAVNSDFMPEGLCLSEILALIPLDAALVAPIVTSQGSAVFVIPSGQSTVNIEQVLWIDEFKASELQSLLSVRTEEAQLGGWLGAYFNSRTNMEAWCDTIEATSQVLWTRLMAPIAERLATLQITQVLLMPQGGLGLLPLHAAWREVDGTRRYFLDDYSVTYLPSVYARKVSSERMSEPQRQKCSLLALINPTEDLPFTPAEGEQVASLFEKGTLTVLSGADATTEAVMKQEMATYVHFSCHGFYNWHHPMQSGLVLAKGEHLTVAQIIGKLNLDSTRLVTLSACETGITDIRQAPDEYQGLPAGFLQAGAPAVVSTLWAVNDLSTMLLMERFYFFHLRKSMGVSEALRQAQIWLRDATIDGLTQRLADEKKTMFNTNRMSIETAAAYFSRFDRHNPKHQPFAHPYYWAAFTVNGA